MNKRIRIASQIMYDHSLFKCMYQAKYSIGLELIIQTILIKIMKLISTFDLHDRTWSGHYNASNKWWAHETPRAILMNICNYIKKWNKLPSFSIPCFICLHALKDGNGQYCLEFVSDLIWYLTKCITAVISFNHRRLVIIASYSFNLFISAI
jgi:hypothetical protein